MRLMTRPCCGLARWNLPTCALLGLVVFLILLFSSVIKREDSSSQHHWMGFNDREARLAQRLRESEDRGQWLGRQLRLAQSKRRKTTDDGQLDSGCGDEESDSEERCETIHVGIVCAGHNASRTVITLIKSILFYRRNPLQFHFVSDAKARLTLSRLAATWQLPQVDFRFYNAESVVEDVAWIPNKHYSGVHGLLKLTLPKILPPTLDKAIILDTDVVFSTDIYRLWRLFRRFAGGQALGLADNQSDWYIPGKLWKKHRPWPALGRGFNTGVILMDLQKLRQLNWSLLWRSMAENDLMTQLSTSLADQDIFNAVIKRRSELLYQLSCSWNLQLSENTLSESLCLNQTKEVNIVHFNSPKKFQTVKAGGKSRENYFLSLHQTFLQLDGNLLRRDLFFCAEETSEESSADVVEGRNEPQHAGEKDGHDKEEPGETMDAAGHDLSESAESRSKLCQEIKTAGLIQYRTHLFYLPYCGAGRGTDGTQNSSVTLVLQLSIDRIHMMDVLARSWKGPMSIAIYLTDAETLTFQEVYDNSFVLKTRCNIGYHVVFRENQFYPVNFLRNLALENVDTPYVFLSDIDFLPSDRIEESLARHADALLKPHKTNDAMPQNEDDLRVLVVPAFESERYRSFALSSSGAGQSPGGGSEPGLGTPGSSQTQGYPTTKAELISQLDVGVIVTFRQHVWPQGHAATNYPKWKLATLPYQARWSENYEPYILASAKIPRYDTRFVGFGWNKVSHIHHLHLLGYKFIVLPNVFIVHTPHTPSLDIYKFRSSTEYRACLEELKKSFIQEKSAEIQRSHMTPPPQV